MPYRSIHLVSFVVHPSVRHRWSLTWRRTPAPHGPPPRASRSPASGSWPGPDHRTRVGVGKNRGPIRALLGRVFSRHKRGCRKEARSDSVFVGSCVVTCAYAYIHVSRRTWRWRSMRSCHRRRTSPRSCTSHVYTGMGQWTVTLIHSYGNNGYQPPQKTKLPRN